MSPFHRSFRCGLAACLLGIGALAAAAGSAVPETSAPAETPAAVSAASADGPAQFIILDFHTFLGNKDSSIDFPDPEFAAILDRLVAMGYRFVRLEDAVAGRIEGRNNLVLTIDDGNHSVWQMVRNVLAPRKIPAFLFIYPGIVDSRPFALTGARIRELAELGCGIGAHGWFHEYMTSKAWAKNRAKVMLEVNRPGPLLKRITGEQPVHFAYPFGVGAPEAGQELLKAGYQWIYTADTVVVPITVNGTGICDPAIKPTAIPRTLVFRWYLPRMYKLLEAHLKD